MAIIKRYVCPKHGITCIKYNEERKEYVCNKKGCFRKAILQTSDG